MTKSGEGTAQRRKLLSEIERLAEIAIFGTLSETYRTCGRAGCHCQGDGPKHGPHLKVSERGEKGKTTGYYVPKGAEKATPRQADTRNRQQESSCSKRLLSQNTPPQTRTPEFAKNVNPLCRILSRKKTAMPNK